MEKFKVDLANELINTLTVLSSNIPDNNPDKKGLLFSISDCILKFDILNEDTIGMKCAALFKLGKKNLAKQTYDLFFREYKQLLGVDFALPFHELVRGHSDPLNTREFTEAMN